MAGNGPCRPAWRCSSATRSRRQQRPRAPACARPSRRARSSGSARPAPPPSAPPKPLGHAAACRQSPQQQIDLNAVRARLTECQSHQRPPGHRRATRPTRNGWVEAAAGRRTWRGSCTARLGPPWAASGPPRVGHARARQVSRLRPRPAPVPAPARTPPCAAARSPRPPAPPRPSGCASAARRAASRPDRLRRLPPPPPGRPRS